MFNLSQELIHAAKERILILDGAMGTMIQKHALTEDDFRGNEFIDFHKSIKGNNDVLSITQPDIITQIHLQYLEAGSDIIETNTFNSQSISMADYDMEDWVTAINKGAVKCAKLARELYYQKHGNHTKKYIAGALGPTNRTASLSPDVNNPSFRNITFDELVISYSVQVKALIEEGIDMLIVETIFDTLNAKAAFYAILSVFDELNIQVPLMASGTITDASGRTLSGQTAQAFAISLSHIPLLSIGFNCALGAEQLEQYVQILDQCSDLLVSAYPNAGLPNAMGEYDQTPIIMGELLKPYLEKGIVNILGGCCGSTPDHIKVIAELASKYPPRKLK